MAAQNQPVVRIKILTTMAGVLLSRCDDFHWVARRLKPAAIARVLALVMVGFGSLQLATGARANTYLNPAIMSGDMPRCSSSEIPSEILVKAVHAFTALRYHAIEPGRRIEGLYVISKYGGGRKVMPEETETTFCNVEATFHLKNESRAIPGVFNFIVKWIYKKNRKYAVEIIEVDCFKHPDCQK